MHYYSIRMHASSETRHVSGAERIVSSNEVDQTVIEMVRRAFGKKTLPSMVSITIDDLGAEELRSLTALDITALTTRSVEDGRRAAVHVLGRAGVSPEAAWKAVDLLGRGPAPGGQNMRGAMIIDAETGKRLEPDAYRGVRASRFDWSPEAEMQIRCLLHEKGLGHFRTKEALALATKIAHGPAVTAELCWSDDPDYSAGYAASFRTGYVRISHLKEPGNDHGGRAIFIDRRTVDLELLVSYLQTQPVLIEKPGRWLAAMDSGEFIKGNTEHV